MEHGLPVSSRSPIHHLPPRFISESGSQSLGHAASAVARPLPLDHHQGLSAFPQLLRNPGLGIRHHPPPPRCSQGYRDLPALLPLELSSLHSQLRHVYETIKVSQTGGHQPELRRTHQLSSHSRRHRSLPHHFLLSPPARNRLHARRADVLYAASNRRSFRTLPTPQPVALQPSGAPRKQLHRSLPSPNHLHLHSEFQQPSLHSRRSSRRKLRPASVRHSLVEASTDLQPVLQSFSDHPGILGPRPLHPHPERVPLERLSRPPSRLVQRPSSSRASRGDVPQPTSSSPPRSIRGLRRSVHLHPSRPNTSDLRPCRLRQDTLKQAKACMGDSSGLGQPANLRALERPCPPKSRVQLLPLSPAKGSALPVPAPQSLLGPSPSILGPRPSNLEGAHSWLTSPLGVIPSDCTPGSSGTSARAFTSRSPTRGSTHPPRTTEPIVFGTLSEDSGLQQVLPGRLPTPLCAPLGIEPIHDPPPFLAPDHSHLPHSGARVTHSGLRAASVHPEPARRVPHPPTPPGIQPELAPRVFPCASSSELPAARHGGQPPTSALAFRVPPVSIDVSPRCSADHSGQPYSVSRPSSPSCSSLDSGTSTPTISATTRTERRSEHVSLSAPSSESLLSFRFPRFSLSGDSC
nr:movement protein [Nemesia ring necrosis virus]